jgi:hypothetical protein
MPCRTVACLVSPWTAMRRTALQAGAHGAQARGLRIGAWVVGLGPEDAATESSNLIRPQEGCGVGQVAPIRCTGFSTATVDFRRALHDRLGLGPVRAAQRWCALRAGRVGVGAVRQDARPPEAGVRVACCVSAGDLGGHAAYPCFASRARVHLSPGRATALHGLAALPAGTIDRAQKFFAATPLGGLAVRRLTG